MLFVQRDRVGKELESIRLDDPPAGDRAHEQVVVAGGHAAGRHNIVAQLRAGEVARVGFGDPPGGVAGQLDRRASQRAAVHRHAAGLAGALEVEHDHGVPGLVEQLGQRADADGALAHKQPAQAAHGVDRQKGIAADEPQPPAALEHVQALDDKKGIGLLLDLAAGAEAELPVELILDAWVDRAAERRVADDIVEAPQRAKRARVDGRRGRVGCKPIPKEIPLHQVMARGAIAPARADVRQAARV